MIRKDRVWNRISGWAALAATTMLAVMLLFLTINAWPALREPGLWKIFSGQEWLPSEGYFSLLPMLGASVALAVGSLGLTLLYALAVSIIISEYLPGRAQGSAYHTLKIMSGVPSVLYGLFGLEFLVPRLGVWFSPGQSLLAGILVLTLMNIPTAALLMTASFRRITRSEKEPAIALGISRWSVFLGSVLPRSKGSIKAAMILSFARSMGETIAVVLVTGNLAQFPASLETPVRALTANIALEMGFANDTHRSVLFLSGFFLVLLAFGAAAFGERCLNDNSTDPGVSEGT